ncbi:MAG: hypothetical protein V1870_05840 [Candidatus Aenigmatarchaeota archaeon]
MKKYVSDISGNTPMAMPSQCSAIGNMNDRPPEYRLVVRPEDVPVVYDIFGHIEAIISAMKSGVASYEEKDGKLE